MAVPTKSKGRRIITVMIFQAFLGSPIPVTTSHILATFFMPDVSFTNLHDVMTVKTILCFKLFVTIRTLDFFPQFHFCNV